MHTKSLRCTDCLEPERKLADNHEGLDGAGGEGGPAQAQAAEHCKTLPAPRCGRTATHAMGGMKGAPGLAGRDPPRDEEAARKCPDCGDKFAPGGFCEGCNYRDCLCPDCGDEIGPSGCCEDCNYCDYLEACKTCAAPCRVRTATRAMGRIKGVPAHGVGARPASHGAGERGDFKAWFGGVRVSTALHGCTRQYSCAT